MIRRRPTSKEDLTFYFDSTMSQADKQIIIAKMYDASVTTAKRWMAEFGLLNKSTRQIKLEKQYKDVKKVNIDNLLNKLKNTNASITISSNEAQDILNYIEYLKSLIIQKDSEIADKNKKISDFLIQEAEEKYR